MIKKIISVTTHALYPLPPVTNCHTFSGPLERDVLYGRPLRSECLFRLIHSLLSDLWLPYFDHISRKNCNFSVGQRYHLKYRPNFVLVFPFIFPLHSSFYYYL